MRNITPYARCCRKAWITLIAVVFALAAAPQARAEERQYKIEAAFLYSFFNYITWPSFSSPQELNKPVICVYSDDPIIPYLHYIRGKMAGERTLDIRAITGTENISECHMLFIRHRITSAALEEPGSNTLVVFKPDDPLDRGGMVELSQDGERINVSINQSRLERSGFQVSSRLLELAQRVK